MITTISNGNRSTTPISLRKKLKSIFKKAKQIRPKYNLTAAQMDELNEKMFR